MRISRSVCISDQSTLSIAHTSRHGQDPAQDSCARFPSRIRSSFRSSDFVLDLHVGFTPPGTPARCLSRLLTPPPALSRSSCRIAIAQKPKSVANKHKRRWEDESEKHSKGTARSAGEKGGVRGSKGKMTRGKMEGAERREAVKPWEGGAMDLMYQRQSKPDTRLLLVFAETGGKYKSGGRFPSSVLAADPVMVTLKLFVALFVAIVHATAVGSSPVLHHPMIEPADSWSRQP